MFTEAATAFFALLASLNLGWEAAVLAFLAGGAFGAIAAVALVILLLLVFFLIGVLIVWLFGPKEAPKNPQNAPAPAPSVTPTPGPSPPPPAPKDEKSKECLTGASLIDGPGVHRLVLESLPENARRFLVARGLPTKPALLRTDRANFFRTVRQQVNAAVLGASTCSKSAPKTARAEGLKHFDDVPHAEMNAKPTLKTQVEAWPIEERRGGVLAVTARSDVCGVCLPDLRLLRQYLLPGGRLEQASGTGWPDPTDTVARESYNRQWEALSGRPMPPSWRT